MKKAIACLLALPLALAACGAQGADSAQSQPATETEQTPETAQNTTAPAVGTAGKLRGTAYTLYTNTGLYSMNQKYDEATNTNTFYLIKTDCDTATQQKLAEIELQGGETCGMAAWDDMVELYCFENMDKGNPTEWCYIVDTSTGSVERLPVEEEFYPAWYDDAALYELDYASGKRIIRRDRTTNEVSYINLPEQTINVYGAGDKWVIHRIVSPSPLPSNVDGDEYNAVFQNSEYEYDLFDAATGEMKKTLQLSHK